jgi:hypothetical protein
MDVAIFVNPELAPDELSGYDATLAIITRADADTSGFDRVAATDPGLAERVDAWRTVPFPLDDSQFRDIEPVTGEPRICVDGEPTPKREGFLRSLGLEDLPFVTDDRDGCDVVIHLHEGRDEGAPERISRDIAAGRLVIADEHRPRHDLVSGMHYVEARSGWHLGQLVWDLRRWPDNHDVVRMRARNRAELSRTSALYPRLAEDLYRDLGAFGPKT